MSLLTFMLKFRALFTNVVGYIQRVSIQVPPCNLMVNRFFSAGGRFVFGVILKFPIRQRTFAPSVKFKAE